MLPMRMCRLFRGTRTGVSDAGTRSRGASSSSRFNSDGTSVFDKLRDEKLRYKHEDGYYEQVESLTPRSRTDRDASEVRSSMTGERTNHSWRNDEKEYKSFDN